jgi:hypothetical protein
MPTIEPDPGAAVATAVLLLVHVPPVMASLRTIVKPWQTFAAPIIAEGVGRTVTVVVVMHPFVYIITAVPGAMPETMPVVAPIVAVPVLPLLQVPPVVVLLSFVIAVPMHTTVLPVIAAGLAPTVTTVLIVQLVPNE